MFTLAFKIKDKSFFLFKFASLDQTSDELQLKGFDVLDAGIDGAREGSFLFATHNEFPNLQFKVVRVNVDTKTISVRDVTLFIRKALSEKTSIGAVKR